VPEQGPKYKHYKLLVTGVTLYSNLKYDDCGWPYELVESPMMKPTECEKKVGDVLNRIEKGQKEFTESTTRKEFLAAVKRWEKMLRSIKCDEPGEVFYVESVTVDKEVQNADFFVSGGFVFSVSNRKDPKLQARWRKRFKKITPEEHARQSLEAGNMLKEYVEKHLSKLKFSQNPRQ